MVKNYTPVGLSMIAAHDSMTQDENGVRLSMTTANVPPALNTYNQSSQDRIKSDCINLATNSQRVSQDGPARKASKSASRVRAEGYDTRKENDEILTYENDFDVQQASLEQLKLKAQLYNAKRKNKTSEGTRRSMPVGNIAYNDNDAVQVNTLTPMMESMDTPRIFK